MIYSLFCMRAHCITKYAISFLKLNTLTTELKYSIMGILIHAYRRQFIFTGTLRSRSAIRKECIFYTHHLLCELILFCMEFLLFLFYKNYVAIICLAIFIEHSIDHVLFCSMNLDSSWNYWYFDTVGGKNLSRIRIETIFPWFSSPETLHLGTFTLLCLQK